AVSARAPAPLMPVSLRAVRRPRFGDAASVSTPASPMLLQLRDSSVREPSCFDWANASAANGPMRWLRLRSREVKAGNDVDAARATTPASPIWVLARPREHSRNRTG